MEWFKFYSSRWLSDLAIKQLSVVDRLIFVTLLCVTNVTDETEERNGLVTNFSEDAIISLTGLHQDVYNPETCDVQNAYGFTKRLENLGLVELLEDGSLLIKSYKKRQNSQLSNAERQKRYREKNKVTSVKKKVTKQSNDSNARVEKSRVDNTSEETSQEIPEIIKAFETVNPNCKRYYGNKTQRQACKDLVDLYGFDRVMVVVEKTLPKTNTMEYFPTIITPVQLRDKWAALESAVRKKQASTQTLKNNVAFT